MTMLDVHAEALDQNTAYHEFLLYYRRVGQVVYGFVEGSQDPSFYRTLIDSVLPSGWRVKLIQAGKRDKVIQTCENMDWSRFDRRRVCFFVDRDLTVFLGAEEGLSENIYVTDQYSIENEVITGETLFRVLEEVFTIVGMAPEEEDKIRLLFSNEYRRFCEAMAGPMAQILIWRRNGNRPCLNNIKLKEWFEFSAGSLSLKGEYRSLTARVQNLSDRCGSEGAEKEVLEEAEAEFREMGGVDNYVRGKYVLWFFVNFLWSVYESISEYCARYAAKKPKVRVSFGVENAIVLLAGRARAPESLRNFLLATYVAYINGIPEGQSVLPLGE